MGELASITIALIAAARSQRLWSSTRSDRDAGGRDGGK